MSQSAAAVPLATRHGFCASVDCTKTTRELYSSADPLPCPTPDSLFTPRFRAARLQLDYKWHGVYSLARQEVQDDLIERLLTQGARSTRPWLVFTAGAMGAGKSHVLSDLATGERYFEISHGSPLFPLHAFIHCDPDVIKSMLPEASALAEFDRMTAAAKLHSESVTVSEILNRVALMQSRNIVVDSSLRDSVWYSAFIKSIRESFPTYRIAILMVTAPSHLVLQRAERRAQITGRLIPRQVLEATLEAVPESYRLLSPLVDYHATFNNAEDGKAAVLLPPETWESFMSQFADVCLDSPPQLK
jgi:hypothetical protein